MMRVARAGRLEGELHHRLWNRRRAAEARAAYARSSDGNCRCWEPFDRLSAGRRLRSILRFAHTGEVLGLAGQTIAGTRVVWCRDARLFGPCAVAAPLPRLAPPGQFSIRDARVERGLGAHR